MNALQIRLEELLDGLNKPEPDWFIESILKEAN